MLQGLQDQLDIMGQSCIISNAITGATTPAFTAIVTARNGKTEVEISGITYTVTGHALIPATATLPKIGERLETEGELWLIVSVVKSATDPAYSCELVRLK